MVEDITEGVAGVVEAFTEVGAVVVDDNTELVVVVL
jgi:hypothetical protein